MGKKTSYRIRKDLLAGKGNGELYQAVVALVAVADIYIDEKRLKRLEPKLRGLFEPVDF